MTLTFTFRKLVDFESTGQRLFASRSLSGKIILTYWEQEAQSKDDRVVAMPQDFAEADGLTTLGWQDMSAEEIDAIADSEFSIEIN